MSGLAGSFESLRALYRRTLSFCIFLTCTAVVMAAYLTYKSMRPSQPQYYATTRQGDIIPMFALSEPLVTNQYIEEWSALAVRQSFSLNFLKFQEEIRGVTPFFTDKGLRAFKRALYKSGLAKSVSDKHLIISAIVNGTVVIVNQGVIGKRYTWLLQVPVLLTYESASTNVRKQLLVRMVVSRVSTLDALQGIQIDGLSTSSQFIK